MVSLTGVEPALVNLERGCDLPLIISDIKWHATEVSILAGENLESSLFAGT